jgi:predicted DNA-binding transcriptional regulator YafY
VIDTENQHENKWIPATFRFNDKQEAIEFLLGFANKIKAVSPNDLPDKVVSLASLLSTFTIMNKRFLMNS